MLLMWSAGQKECHRECMMYYMKGSMRLRVEGRFLIVLVVLDEEEEAQSGRPIKGAHMQYPLCPLRLKVDSKEREEEELSLEMKVLILCSRSSRHQQMPINLALQHLHQCLVHLVQPPEDLARALFLHAAQQHRSLAPVRRELKQRGQ
mmetsp:Transcript_29429/g.75893  ORF Transcript_29429/g.75893 Transcript_29429/m.75893 type:complete len:148 (-) Transcript_29429:776-1219(-)